MPRIDEMPQYRAKLPKNVHDLSHKFGFTATVAHLLPVFHDLLNPGETVELAFNYNLRTQPLQSAAMVEITGHVEYFFVPMFLLYEPFGSMFYNLNDQYSSNFPLRFSSQNVQDEFPVLDFGTNAQSNGLYDVMGSDDSVVIGFEEWYNHVYRLFDMLGYNNSGINHNGSGYWNPNVFPYPILAYNCIYQYYYRLDNRERFDQNKFNWDKFYNTNVVNEGNLGLLLRQVIRLWYRPKDSDYFTDIKVSPIVDVLNLNKKDSFEIAKQWLSRGIVDGNNVLSSGSIGSDSEDGLGNTSPFDSSNPLAVIQTQFGFKQTNSDEQSSSDPWTYPYNGFDIGTANIRAMFASEKLWSITGRARKHYDDQTLAHFGVKVPHDVKHEISCFGHDRAQIHIGEVIATSNVVVGSGGSVVNGGLGEIAGKGYGQMQNKPHKFTAPCHGVVMAILSFVPEVTYGNCYQKCNAVSNRQDLYMPEYDHLGMQPQFAYEAGVTSSDYRTNIAGWQYRYEQWKRRFNRVSKAFTGNGSLDSWMLDFTAPAKTLVNSSNNQQFRDFLHSPSELNQIMLVNYVTAASGYSVADESKVYDGDPFVIDGYVHCKKVSTMSDYSLPRLDV